MTEIFIKQRKLQDEPDKVKPVKIDDACAFLARFESGALGTFEINGEKGSVAFDLENAHELNYFNYGDDGHVRGWRKIQAWDSDHPYMKHWWVPGCGIGYEHWHINTLADFLSGIEKDRKTCPDFRDALATQYVCDAVLASAKNNKWETIPSD